jgi:hypothetical protein
MDYMSQTIRSECGLQVYLAARLMEAFRIESVTRRLFVKPRIKLNTELAVLPDLLVYNRQSIIGVVELNYQPRVKPNSSKDVSARLRKS